MKDLRIVNNEQFLDEESMKIILLRLFNIFPSMVNLFWGYKKKKTNFFNIFLAKA